MKLDAEAIEKDVGVMSKSITRSYKQFQKWGNEGCSAIASTIKEQLDNFRPQVPLLLALRNRGMRDRHWDDLSSQLGFPLHPGEKFSLQVCVCVCVLSLSDKYFFCMVCAGRVRSKFA